ncbi:IclR family transcriptional regulator [Vannielia sp.]|uniref:IclR family transcriptional regulator n=1 Tax=Vannielia sp. TaxID=2813045 RepID=UPI003BA8A94E
MSQEGTQAIRRAAAILQRIAHISDDTPATLRDISESLDLPRSTAHRILKCLTETGLAAYNPATRRYEIGMLSYELGLAVTDRALDLSPFAAAVDRIAERANVTTYLMRRSGVEAVCVHKAEGRTVIRVIPVEVGHRRFLGVGAGATALLADLGDAALERILTAIGPELHRYHDVSAESIRASVAEARETGFAESRSKVYKSIYGLGKAITSRVPSSDLAISIAVHAPDVDDALIARWKAIISEEIQKVHDTRSPGAEGQATAG